MRRRRSTKYHTILGNLAMASSTPPPPHYNPWFLGFTPNSTSYSPSNAAAVITVATSAPGLGQHLIHLRCSDHLHLLLSPLSLSGYHYDNFRSLCDIWCQRRLKGNFLLDSFADAFSMLCSSCLSFFSGTDPRKGYHDKQKMQIKTIDENYFNGRQWTNIILTLNILVYVAQVASHGKLTLWGAKVNSLIDRGQLWRLATSSFLHANIGHLMMNCYSLNSIGPTVEHLSGPRRFLAVYFTSALSSSLMSYKFCQLPSVGASGAIFGLVGSFAVFVLRHKNLLGGGKQDLQEIARVLMLNMAIGLVSRGIDNWCHLGGLLGGAAISWFLGPAWKYKFLLDRGSVLVDSAPIFRLIKRKRLR